MLRSLTLLALLGLIAGPVPAQAASFLTFGNACAIDAPSLAARTLPKIGSTFVVETSSRGVGGYEGRGTTFLAAGASRTMWQGVPLPWNPAMFASLLGAFSCGDLSIALDMIAMVPLTTSPQLVQLPVAIPNVPSLIGTSVYLQPFVVEPSRRGLLVLTFGDARIGT